MRKATRSASNIEVKIGRYNEPTEVVEVAKGSSVEEVLDTANISLGDSESVWVDGVEAEGTDTVEKGDNLQIVGKKDGGNDNDKGNV